MAYLFMLKGKYAIAPSGGHRCEHHYHLRLSAAFSPLYFVEVRKYNLLRRSPDEYVYHFVIPEGKDNSIIERVNNKRSLIR